MTPLDFLLWAAAIIVGIIALCIVIGVLVFIVAVIYGFNAWRKDQSKDDVTVFKGGDR